MIVVTGGAGFIGSNLVRGLNAQGKRDILVVDDLEDGDKHRNLNALDFTDLVDHRAFTADPERYAGSTPGPRYNEKGSPLQVTWSVRPRVAKVSIRSVAAWLENNSFDEKGAHGVRNLVTNPDLLSPID